MPSKSAAAECCLPMVLRKVFEVFEKYRTSIDMIATSEVAVSVTIDDATYLKNIVAELQPFGTVTHEANQSIVSVVGNEITDTENALMKLFDALENIPVRMVSYGGSRHNISLLVPTEYRTETLKAINQHLFGL